MSRASAIRTSIELRGFGFQIGDAVLEGGRAATKIDGCIPIASARYHHSRRQHFEVPPVIVMRPAAFEVLKVCIAHHSHIALVRALNDDSIASS